MAAATIGEDVTNVPVPEQDVTLYTGDTFSLALSVVDSTGTPQDQSGYVWTAQLRDQPGGTMLETFAIDMSNAAGGVVTISLTPTQTTALLTASPLVTEAWFDMKRSASGGITTMLRGKVSIEQNVTVP